MIDLGRVGVWTFGFRTEGVDPTLAAELESLGYSAVWTPGGAGGRVLEACERVLAATERLVAATGILNVWRHEPAQVAEQSMAMGERFLLGIGISHQALIGEDYRSPLQVMTDYLDALDAAGHVPERRVVAALRPRMLRLAADRSAGTHPYFVPVTHAAAAREVVGPGKLVAPEVTVVLDPDPVTARATARRFMATYLQLPNYTNNLRRLGWTDDDLAGEGSDALVDAIVAWGDAEAIAARVAEHHANGADHVCLQVLGSDEPVPMAALRALAPALFP
jgi:probable F420-dependent oxidoreductase